MYCVSKGIEAMGSVGKAGHHIKSLSFSAPLSVQILVLIVFLIALFGTLKRFREIMAGKASVMDFIGMIIMVVLFALFIMVLGSGVLKHVLY